jgi:hypothetical protein
MLLCLAVYDVDAIVGLGKAKLEPGCEADIPEVGVYEGHDTEQSVFPAVDVEFRDVETAVGDVGLEPLFGNGVVDQGEVVEGGVNVEPAWRPSFESLG